MINSNCEMLLIVRHIPISEMLEYRKMHISKLSKYSILCIKFRESLINLFFIYILQKNNLEILIGIKKKQVPVCNYL